MGHIEINSKICASDIFKGKTKELENTSLTKDPLDTNNEEEIDEEFTF